MKCRLPATLCAAQLRLACARANTNLSPLPLDTLQPIARCVFSIVQWCISFASRRLEGRMPTCWHAVASAPAQQWPPPPLSGAILVIMALCAELFRLLHTNPSPKCLISTSRWVATDLQYSRGHLRAAPLSLPTLVERGPGDSPAKVGDLDKTGEWDADDALD